MFTHVQQKYWTAGLLYCCGCMILPLHYRTLTRKLMCLLIFLQLFKKWDDKAGFDVLCGTQWSRTHHEYHKRRAGALFSQFQFLMYGTLQEDFWVSNSRGGWAEHPPLCYLCFHLGPWYWHVWEWCTTFSKNRVYCPSGLGNILLPFSKTKFHLRCSIGTTCSLV